MQKLLLKPTGSAEQPGLAWTLQAALAKAVCPCHEACRSIASTTFPKMFCCLTLLTTKANDNDNDCVQTHTYVVCFHYFVKLPQVRLKRLLKYLLHTSCHLLSVLLKILSKRRLALHHNSLFLG